MMNRNWRALAGRSLMATAGIVAAVSILATASAQASWPTHEWEAVCDVPADCEDAGVVYAAELQRAGEWLESLGFRPPVLERSVLGPWRFHVSEEAADGNLGLYYVDSDTGRGTLVLRPDAFFAVGVPGLDQDSESMQVADASAFVAVHELFHAVQERYGMPHHDHDEGARGTHDWIVEGTPEAVVRAYIDHVVGSLPVLMEARAFDTPIHEPDAALGRTGAYGTWYFWRTLGQELGSRHDIAYLATLMEEDLEPHAGIQGLDRFLSDRGGLQQTLPRVFARMEADRDFGEQRSWSTTMRLGGGEDVHDVDVSVMKLAATSLRVDLRVDGDQAAIAQLRLRGDVPELHLVVDGTVLVETDGEARNTTSRFVMPGEAQSLDVLVVNVSEWAPDSEDLDATLEVTYVPLACPDGSGGLREITREATGVACLELDVAGRGPSGVRVVANLATIQGQQPDEHPRYSFRGPFAGVQSTYVYGPHGDASLMLITPEPATGAVYGADPSDGDAQAQVRITVPGQHAPTGSVTDFILRDSTVRIARYERHPWGWVFSGSFEGLLCCFGGAADGDERAEGRFFIVQTCGPDAYRDATRNTCRRRL